LTLADFKDRPRNGKAITTSQFSNAIISAYNVEPSFALTLAGGALSLTNNASGLAALTAPVTSTIDLNQLSKHDVIEHDASLTRHDDAQGDNNSIQPKLVEALLADVQGDYITADSLAKTRARREQESMTQGSKKALGTTALMLAYGEAALLLQALGVPVNGTDWRAKKSDVRTWLGEEKLPEGWTKPPLQITMAHTTSMAGDIYKLSQKYRSGVTQAGSASKAKKGYISRIKRFHN
jgi:hypothetical protein